MSFKEKYIRWFKRLLPSPFIIAILLTIITLILALVFSDKSVLELANFWQTGLWDSKLLVFAFQMMMMLVLGHVLALSSFFNKVIFYIIKPVKNNAQAAFVVVFSTILVAYFNWGLGLIFGAILARKLGEKFSSSQTPLNYPLIAAGGYVGLMVWHGGISGSALAKVSDKGHVQAMAQDIGLNPADFPLSIPYPETVFSTMNIAVGTCLLLCLPFLFYYIGKIKKGKLNSISPEPIKELEDERLEGLERLEIMSWANKLMGVLCLSLAVYLAINYTGRVLGFITPNYINFFLLGLCLLLHENFRSFLHAVNQAIVGASGILIQFPLYFGILALMNHGGLIEMISQTFVSISNETTLPIFTFICAGFVNIFVPSGGGQWAIQGPIILDAASQVGVPLPKMIMALAYGDQLTNMLQPFWALPLLSITGLKAKDILPYTLILFAGGVIIFGLGLLFF